jgi:predicted O-methyltransferase YrrM
MAGASSRPRDPDAFAAALARARAAWLDAMDEHRTRPGMVDMPPARALGDAHVANCTLVANRERIVERMPKGGAIAEVGVLRGRFSRRLLDIAAPRELHLFDTSFARHGVAERFGREIEAGAVHLHEGLSWERLPELPDGALDFIYLDADHSYEGVTRDIGVAKRKLRPDGFLIFNDYTYWSPLECLKYGVVEAVNELCLDDGWEMIYLALAARMYCDVALRRRA